MFGGMLALGIAMLVVAVCMAVVMIVRFMDNETVPMNAKVATAIVLCTGALLVGLASEGLS